MRRLWRAAPLLLLGGCLHEFYSTVPRQVSPRVVPRAFTSPARVHLHDGATVVFKGGLIIQQQGITGRGLRYGLLSSVGTEVTSVPLDSVASIVVFEEKFDRVPSFVATLVGSVGAAVLGYILFIIIIYSQTGYT